MYLMYLLERAFRPFFFGALLFAVLAMLIWWQQYPHGGGFSGISAMNWHAHEMIFGYALATVSGFLLTAVVNWTRNPTPTGYRLLLLFILWLGARAGYLLELPLTWIALFDMGFVTLLFTLFFLPIWQKRQTGQFGLAGLFALIILANGIFYAGAFNLIEHGERTGIVLGLFLVLAINLTMMRRLIPFFTEKALQLADLKQSPWLDGIALGGFLVLMLLVIWLPNHPVTAFIGIGIALLHAIRWWRWYHPGIWNIVLIWPLYLAYGFMILGMALFGMSAVQLVAQSLAIHALAAGGIGLLCSAILARIALGHTNRNVFEPPRIVFWVFVILALNGAIRVFLPWLMPQHYALWIEISQWGWISGFGLLAIAYWKILLLPAPAKEVFNLR